MGHDKMASNNMARRPRVPKYRTAGLAGCGALVCTAVLWAWYVWLADYGYSAVAGTYVYQDDKQKATLILFQNHVFDEVLVTGNGTEKARGSWERSGEAGVAFSPDFLILTGQSKAGDHVWGHVRKTLGGLHQSIVFRRDDGEDGPAFSKRMFQ